MRLYRGLIVFLFVVGVGLSGCAGGKVSYRTVEGVGLKVAIPFGPSDTYPVKQVIDGDTIELGDGQLVRYLGVDAPEVRRREGENWVYDPQPFSEEATAFNRTLVEGKQVRLEFDREKRDRFGRLLAYVFVKMDPAGPALYDGEVFLESHEIFVNAYLLKEGYATLLVLPPNLRHAQHLKRVETEARQGRRNLWAGSDSQQGGIHAGQR